ncbi:F-box/FBD/LRR-repeat protein At1g13570-like [Bidens hawaiensis]|uniref:F-box/FBD/LRR-repeat protein At1g13570-like n=1 Tax=Bidens hawaiensis TaxID=980011 RepID=UPI004049C297
MVFLNLMTENHKHKRFVTDKDIISNLSPDLIDPILELLPIKDAVRTSVLSKKWRYVWTTMTSLSFDEEFSKKLTKRRALHHNGFIRTINKIMINHKGPILNFHLYIPDIVLDSFQEVDQWMLILSRNRVQMLILLNSNKVYPLSYSVFSCVELTILVLHNCIFKPPVGFEGFPNLINLNMEGIWFGDHLAGTVINLPLLRVLTLDCCVNVDSFNIKAVNLQTLWVISCHDATLLRLLHSELLAAVRICLLKSIDESLQVERFTLAMMLRKLPNILSFTIDSYFLKFLAAQKFPKWLPGELKYLKKLEFESFSFSDLDQLQGALCMLRNSPNLEELSVTHIPMGDEADMELTSSYLQSLDCLDQTQFMLRTVEITSFEGSRPELLFVELLLDHSPHLENMIIQPRATADAQKMLSIAKDVMLFSRASSKAKMVYLYPES